MINNKKGKMVKGRGKRESRKDERRKGGGRWTSARASNQRGLNEQHTWIRSVPLRKGGNFFKNSQIV
jgi:hypothetical protein